MEELPDLLDVVSPGSEVLEKQSIKSGQDESGVIASPTSLITDEVTQDKILTSGNPFKMPDDSKIWEYREKEKQHKLLAMERQKGLKIHEKIPYKSILHPRISSMKKIDDDKTKSREEIIKEDADHSLAVTRDRYVERESLTDYIAKKREIFLVEYSLSVKRNEILKLQKMVEKEREHLDKGEQRLFEEASTFDSFLKENNRRCNTAIREAEKEAREKAEKVIEIKHLSALLVAVKSEIAKYEDLLREYSIYKEFLEELTPQEWKDEKQKDKRPQTETFDESERALVDKGVQKLGSHSGKKVKKQKEKKTVKRFPKKKSTTTDSLRSTAEESGSKNSNFDNDEDDETIDEELELYFTEPKELLAMFTELEEQNLSLIQNSQVSEETIEDLKYNMRDTKEKKDNAILKLRQQIKDLNMNIEKEETKLKLFKMKAQFCNFGEYDDEGNQDLLYDVNKKVELVYEACIGSNYANISTLQMLTNIENRIEELFELMERMPLEKLEHAQKVKEKERRRRLRQDKALHQKLQQEERVKKALARSNAEVRKQMGRKLVFRSQPARKRNQEEENLNQLRRDEEEYSFFFKE